MSSMPRDASPSRLRKAFRIGVLRAGSAPTYKPIATVGISRDGGIFVAPAPIGGHDWTYGIVRPTAPRDGEHVTTNQRPKLHYHRSGVAAVTLTGNELERRTLRLPPIPTIESAQILSVVCLRPWELATAVGPRIGDAFVTHPTWPNSIGYSLSVLVASEAEQAKLITPELAPAGLLAGPTWTRFVVSLDGYGHQALLVGTVNVDDENDPGYFSGTTVTALRWKRNDRDSLTESLGLWSASLRNPTIFYEEELPASLEPAHSTSRRTIARVLDDNCTH